MAKEYLIDCKDLGVDCEFTARAAGIDEVIEFCADHAKQEHGVKSFPPELFAKMRAAVHAEEVSAP